MECPYIYGDNQSILVKSSVPDSVLQKKSNGCAYHFVREGLCFDEWRCCYVNMSKNPADLATKPLPAGKKSDLFCSMLLHYLVPENDEVIIDV